MSAREVNFDGLIGPSHNYGGMSEGNLASSINAGAFSNPREAALQGLEKMRLLIRAGLTQGILPPLPRPNFDLLVSAGFGGSDAVIIEQAAKEAPQLLKAAYSASSMWAANAATVSPSADCADGRLHASVANLQTMLHRILEAEQTERTLRRLLADDAHFAVHPALLGHDAFSDEGAANHMRLAKDAGASGVEVFIYGRRANEQRSGFPARQTLEACEALARRHGLSGERTIFAQQAAGAPDRGHGLGREQGVELGSDLGRFPDPQNLREIDGIMRDHSIGRHRD